MPVGLVQSLVHDHLKGAGVVDLAHWILVGHLFGLDEIFASQLHAVNAAHACSFVQQTLHVVNGFRATCTAVSAGTCGMRHHAREMVVNGLNVVDAALHPRANEHLDGQTGHGGVSPHIGQSFDAQTQNFAVLGQGQRGFGLNVAAMGAA